METAQKLLMNSKQVQQRINRLAWQVAEQCFGETEIIMAGIASNGCKLAERLKATIESISEIKIRLIELHINKEAPLAAPILLPVSSVDLNGKTVIVVDDVSNSGRTLMYGVKPFLEHPVRNIFTLVLVDRDHNRFPVKTNFVGLSLATTLLEHVQVDFHENNEATVYLN
ncbi:MAG: phosphoribosyltransferase [Bacteroidia bacterium]|jgi:pyrimidine operon attenuation protein/uracil phosphoribosyltransferase|nr:phosphoribosyltransferase [Bacteroidia bacterium]